MISPQFAENHAFTPQEFALYDVDVSMLRAKVDHAIKYVALAGAELGKLEEELESFLTSYYARVGDLFFRLEQLKQKIGAHGIAPYTPVPAELTPTIDSSTHQSQIQ